jgi:succinate dehydrogenase/fumarate reductase flavoprotein subunit
MSESKSRMKKEIEMLKKEIEKARETGNDLIKICLVSNKQEMQKKLDDFLEMIEYII